MPRPRTRSDDEILDATARVLAAKGPNDFTLADVAERVKLSPATLIQRFGTKRGLLLAFARRESDAGGLPEKGPKGLASLRAALLELAATVGQRRALVHSMELLLRDVRDPELRTLARGHAERVEADIAAHLAAAGVDGDVAATARALQAIYNGAIIQWALRGEGSLADWLGASLDPFLSRLGESARPPPRSCTGQRRT